MKFWIVQAQENPPTPRSDKVRREWRANTLAETLADRGHEVVRWGSAFSHQAKKQLVSGSARVATDNYCYQYIADPGYRRHVGLRRVLSHRALGRNFTKIARNYPAPPDAIHVGNVPIELCHAAVSYGREMGVPVIVDVRDLWPDIYADLLPDALSRWREPLRTWFSTHSGHAGEALAGATGITALTQSFLDWGLAKAKRSEGPCDAVFAMCYPRYEEAPSEAALGALRAKLGLDNGDVLACHIGMIGYQSDFEGLIASAGHLAATHPNFKLILAGTGPNQENLERLAEANPNVILPGWLLAEEIHALMYLATFGLIAYKPVPNFLMNLTNKFPEYLAGGLVVACGLQGEMGRLVEAHDCGFVYEIGDPARLAAHFAALLNDPAALARKAANATALHRAEFDGAIMYPKFADYLEGIVRDHAPTEKENTVRKKTLPRKDHAGAGQTS